MPSLRNFIILTALKIQQLIGDLKESKELNESLQKKHRKWKEHELEVEIEIATLKENHERELQALKMKGPYIYREKVESSDNTRSSQKNLLNKQASLLSHNSSIITKGS